MMNIQQMKFGMLPAVLVVCTLMISTIDLSQNFVFAQDSTSTPATPAFGSNDELSSSDNNDNSNSNADETTSSSGSADEAITAKIVTHNKMQHQTVAMMAMVVYL